ncbi:hypothetical protein BGZ50_008993 [Haplosporangium sp. Z 11]|nr:hypothetical protein BGZ50_008993 [Haplosporangium sp. Z 11]
MEANDDFTAKNPHSRSKELELVLSYLEKNYTLLYDAQGTTVEQRPMAASQAWKAFAKWFNKKANFPLDMAAMKNRVGRMDLLLHDDPKTKPQGRVSTTIRGLDYNSRTLNCSIGQPLMDHARPMNDEGDFDRNKGYDDEEGKRTMNRNVSTAIQPL